MGKTIKKKKMERYIYMSHFAVEQQLCCIAEINTTLLISYTSIKVFFFNHNIGVRIEKKTVIKSGRL